MLDNRSQICVEQRILTFKGNCMFGVCNFNLFCKNIQLTEMSYLKG